MTCNCLETTSVIFFELPFYLHNYSLSSIELYSLIIATGRPISSRIFSWGELQAYVYMTNNVSLIETHRHAVPYVLVPIW